MRGTQVPRVCHMITCVVSCVTALTALGSRLEAQPAPPDRCSGVAVAVLSGGLFGSFEVNSALGMMMTQAIQVDPRRVVGRGFAAGPGQLGKVRQWLQTLSRNCEEPIRVVLVGHSLGGDAVRRSNFGTMCSRIAIDPINPDILPLLNQRSETFPILSPGGRFISILASTTEDQGRVLGRGLLGHHISGAQEAVEANTNHFTVVSRVLEEGIVPREVRACFPRPSPTETPTSTPTDARTAVPTETPISTPTDTPTAAPAETPIPTATCEVPPGTCAEYECWDSASHACINILCTPGAPPVGSAGFPLCSCSCGFCDPCFDFGSYDGTITCPPPNSDVCVYYNQIVCNSPCGH